MPPHEHDVEVVHVDGVRVHLVRTPGDLDDALRFLDEAEAFAGAPLVDATERARLHAAAEDAATLGVHHHAMLARRDTHCVGYAAIVVAGGDAHGVGDLAVHRGDHAPTVVLRTLLAAVDEVTHRHEAHGTLTWMRHADPADVVTAAAAGHAVHRRLEVLGRRLTDADAATSADQRGLTVRHAGPADADAVIEVLGRAYDGSADEGWDATRLAAATAGRWFAWDDVLLAEDAAGVAGLHWTKRRDATTGEVHNLAVSPRAASRGLGRLLLDAGLQHLRLRGCDDVLLWVDLANESAVRLYASAGFEPRWEDVAVIRHARTDAGHRHA